MQNALFNFLSASLIPVLCSDVATCSAGNIHFCLVCVSAVWTLPDQFSVSICDNANFASVTAFLATVGFCIQLRIHYVFVNVLEQSDYSRNIVFHIWNFDITYSATRRKFLELAFKCEFCECINLFSHMHVIRICNVVFVCYAFDFAKATF